MSTSHSSAPVEVKASDLTEQGKIACPSPLAHMELWNGHPRVFLQVAATGEARCPYCGTVYRLAAGEVVAHEH